MTFPGKIGATYKDSTPHWPEAPRPPKGAPNILVVLFDDVGFSDFGCYGSPIETPAIDAVAARRFARDRAVDAVADEGDRRFGAALQTCAAHHQGGKGRGKHVAGAVERAIAHGLDAQTALARLAVDRVDADTALVRGRARHGDHRARRERGKSVREIIG